MVRYREHLRCISNNKIIDGQDGIIYKCIKELYEELEPENAPQNIQCEYCQEYFKPLKI